MTHNYKDRPKYSKKDQYFPKDIITFREDEVFIDCGAYIGDTVLQFLKAAGKQYKKIVAFEPDRINIRSLKRVAKNIVIVKAAVWDCNTKLAFDGENGGGSCVTKNNLADKNCIRAMAIDHVAACADASFIKMDIEGSEYYALQGAYQTICKNKPTLAICIYHSNEDMLRIIELIHSWQLGYKLYVRHHGQRTAETVLYAVNR